MAEIIRCEGFRVPAQEHPFVQSHLTAFRAIWLKDMIAKLSRNDMREKVRIERSTAAELIRCHRNPKLAADVKRIERLLNFHLIEVVE